MKNKPKTRDESLYLSQKAADRVKIKYTEIILEADALQLVHELELQLMELEKQNEELLQARENALTESKKTTKNFIAIEEKYKQIVDTAQEGITMVDKNFCYTFVNPKYCEILGYAQEELLGRDATFFLDANGLELSKKAIEERKKGLKGSVEYSGTHKSGKTIWIRANSTPILDDDGSFKGSISFITDITEHKQMEQEISDNERRLKSIINNALDAVIQIDSTGVIIGWSSHAEKTFGWSSAEVIGHVIHEYIIPLHYRELHIQGIRRFLETGVGKFLNTRFEITALHRNGHEFPIEMTITPITVKGENEFNAFIRDISERKNSEEQLNLYKRALISAVEGILITDAQLQDNPIIFANHGFSVMTGYSDDEILGKNCRFLQGNDTKKDTIDEMRNSIAQNQHFEGEILNYKKDGTPFWNFLRITPIIDSNGITTHFVGFQNDITTRKIDEEKLKESEIRLKEAQFATKVGSWETDLTNLNVIWSDETYNIFELDKNTFKATHPAFLEFVHPDDRQYVDVEFVASYNNTTIYNSIEHRIITHKGTIKFVEERWRIVRDMHDNPILAIGTCQDITARKIDEEKLRKSYKEVLDYKHALDESAIVTFTSTEGIIIYVNDKFCELTQYSREEIVGQSHKFLNSGYHSDEFFRTMWETISHGNIWKGDVCNKAKDGTFHWLGTTIVPLLDENRTIQQYMAVRIDITERKNAEENLRKSEERFRSVIQNIGDIITLLDEQGTILYESPSITNILGYEQDELIGRNVFEFIHKDDEHYIVSFFENALLTQGNAHRIEFRFLAKDGTFITFEAQGNNQLSNPAINAIIITSRDISEWVAVEQKLRNQAALLDVVPDAIIMRNLDNIITFWSKGAEQMYGWTSAEVVGQLISTLLYSPENQEVFNDAFTTFLLQGEWEGELQQQKKDGKKILVHSRWKLLKDTSGNPVSVLVTNTDITEKRSTEQQLLRVQRLESIGTLASGIAHDLNNILTPVVLGMELVKIKIHDDDMKKRIDGIIANVKRGSELIGQVLTFARGTQGERVTVNVKYIASEIVKIARETFPRGIEVQVHIAKDDMIIMGDATQIHQVIMNLCINARDAMENNNGALTVEVARIVVDEMFQRHHVEAKLGEYVVITVQDTGKGIPPELHEKIFEPFFTTKEIGKGTGIGLATVFSIARGHGGFVTLYSEVGKGTKFKVYIPALESEKIEITEETEETPYSKNNELLLFVDDEEIIRVIAEETLIEYGYEVITATNGMEALELYRRNQEKISLVITDMMMPVMGGVELTESLQKINPDVKVIVASGMMAADARERLSSLGISTILGKPITVQKLLEAVSEILA